MRTLRPNGREENKINTKKTGARRRNHSVGQGRLSIVGIGPGALEHLSQKAYATIKDSEVLIGYDAYIRLLGGLTKRKEVFSSGMTQEIERVKLAIDKALEGKKVCLVSSGDPGVYGMAGAFLEFLNKKDARKFKIEIIPGIMAATACASRLGAPLANDFAVISLSDLLTDKRRIETRLRQAVKSDFVIALYNPQSKKRRMLLKKAWKIVSRYRTPHTPVGIVRNGYRLGEQVKIIFLKEAESFEDIDMNTMVIIGNSQTYLKNGYMVTPRGYKTERIRS